MDLHRAERVPQWQTMPVESWNQWQRLANRTNGWVTPGNCVTAIGNILTFTGIYMVAVDHLLLGIIYVGVGRFGDFLDGRVAARTKTKSPLGEAFDAGFDKLQLFAALPVLIAKNMLPVLPGLAIGAEQFCIGIFGAIAKKQGRIIHPTARGKFATGAGWGAFVCFALGENLANLGKDGRFYGWAGPFTTIGYVAAAISLILGAAAIFGYANDAFNGRKSAVEQ